MLWLIIINAFEAKTLNVLSFFEYFFKIFHSNMEFLLPSHHFLPTISFQLLLHWWERWSSPCPRDPILYVSESVCGLWWEMRQNKIYFIMNKISIAYFWYRMPCKSILRARSWLGVLLLCLLWEIESDSVGPTQKPMTRTPVRL